MSYPATVYRVLIASPSDVTDEREMLSRAIYEWNAVNSAHLNAVLLPVRWEIDSTPIFGDRPQSILNQQLVSPSDILIGIFWTRIGTHTGVAESGTAEEIEQFLDAGRPVLLYFSSAPIRPDRIDADQYSRLVEFKGKLLKRGLVEGYDSLPELKDKINRHLTNVVRSMGQEPANTSPAATEPKRRNPAQIASDLAFQKRRTAFLDSPDGVEAAKGEIQKLNYEVQQMVLSLSNPDTGLALSVSLAPDGATVVGNGYSVSFGWAIQYGNTLAHSGLLVTFWKGYLSIGNRIRSSTPVELFEEDYDFDINVAGEHGWRKRGDEDRFFTSASLVEATFSTLLEQIHTDMFK